jgi:hypothetical protein
MDWLGIQPVPRTERPPANLLCHGKDGNVERFGLIAPTLYLGICVATSGNLYPYYDWERPHKTQSRQPAPWQTSEIVPSKCNTILSLDCNTVNYALWHPWISESALKATWSLPVIATYCKLVAVNSSVSEVIWDFCPFVHSSTDCSLLLSA